MKVQLIVWLALCGIGLFTLIIIIIFSFASIGIKEIGLNYSSLFQSIDKKTFSSGFYYIGITHSFLKFPSVVQNIEFSNEPQAHMSPVKSRTLDGLEVQLDVSFQYRLKFEELYNMYMKYGPTYEKVFVLTAINSLTDMTTKFNAYNFFYDRQSIGDTMKAELSKTFNITCHALIEALQLRTVSLPKEFELSIQQTEVKKQDIEKAKAERNKVMVECETRVKEAEFQKNVTINTALGEALRIQMNNKAEVERIIITQLQQADAYVALKQQMKLNTTELLEYIKTKLIKEYQAGNSMVINLDKFNE